MRIPSGKTDQVLYFAAVDATDLKTRETGLSSFTVVRSRKGSADVTYTTPTVTEIDATTMPGLYALLVDEDTTIDSGSDSEEYAVHITHAGMAPVTRVIELYRRDTTSGRTIVVDAAGLADANAVKVGPTGSGTAQTAGDIVAKVDVIDDFLDTEIAAIKAATDNLPSDPADQSLIIAATDAIMTRLGVPVASVSADLAAVKAVDDAVKVKTDALPNSVRDAILSDATPFAGANVDDAISSRLASASITLAGGKVTPIDVDGLTFDDALCALMAVGFGVAERTGSVVAFKQRDGTVTKVAVTVGADGIRTASVVS